MAGAPGVDRAALAARIQGFGNVNPPPLEDDGNPTAKRAIGRLGDLVGEEVMLTVEDFREKGAVGAVKDAVADAGDILIDGVSGIIGWIRGDAPPEDESQATEDANKVLTNGPAGAAYGVSQPSPTGGINAVWVMPEDADPATMAELAAQEAGAGFAQQQLDPRVPRNIQPYQAPPPRAGGAAMGAPPYGLPTVPGGPVIAPYEPAPSGPPLAGQPPFRPQQPAFGGPMPSQFRGLSHGPGLDVGTRMDPPAAWGPSGYSTGGSSGAAAPAPALAGPKALVDRVAGGDAIPGPDVARRLVGQCSAAGVSGKQLGSVIAELARALYLGLPSAPNAAAGDPDSALLRLLTLLDALADQQHPEVGAAAVGEVRRAAADEFLSLRSSAKHKDQADAVLRRLQLQGPASQPVVDLLGSADDGGAAVRTPEPAGGFLAEACGGSAASDLLGPVCPGDLLGGDGPVAGAAASRADVSSLDPVAAAPGMAQTFSPTSSSQLPVGLCLGGRGDGGGPADGGAAAAPEESRSPSALLPGDLCLGGAGIKDIAPS